MFLWSTFANGRLIGRDPVAIIHLSKFIVSESFPFIIFTDLSEIKLAVPCAIFTFRCLAKSFIPPPNFFITRFFHD